VQRANSSLFLSLRASGNSHHAPGADALAAQVIYCLALASR
jgi:hypothetical protein